VFIATFSSSRFRSSHVGEALGIAMMLLIPARVWLTRHGGLPHALSSGRFVEVQHDGTSRLRNDVLR